MEIMYLTLSKQFMSNMLKLQTTVNRQNGHFSFLWPLNHTQLLCRSKDKRSQNQTRTIATTPQNASVQEKSAPQKTDKYTRTHTRTHARTHARTHTHTHTHKQKSKLNIFTLISVKSTTIRMNINQCNVNKTL